MSTIARKLLPSLYDDVGAWVKDDVSKRTIVPMNTRHRRSRRRAILRKLGYVQLHLPSVTPPPPPPPEQVFDQMEGLDVDVERNPYHWVSRDSTGQWRRKTSIAVTPKRVMASALILAFLVIAFLIVMMPRTTIVSFLDRYRIQSA